jgi:serine/threonine protein kinase
VLQNGYRLGAYEIVSPLGAGGMGEVYRAHDTRLNRDVAIKIMPDAFASDPSRVARFVREAQTLASLNHPHIAQIYGVEESLPAGPGHAHTVRALVMELVPGTRSQIALDSDQSRSTRPFRSRGRSPRRSKRHTTPESSIAT